MWLLHFGNKHLICYFWQLIEIFVGYSMNGRNSQTVLPVVKKNGFKESDFVRNEPGRKKLEFVRKIVKARDAPGGSIQLNFPETPNNGKVIEPVDLTEQDPLAVNISILIRIRVFRMKKGVRISTRYISIDKT